MDVLTIVGFILLIAGIILIGVEMVIPGFGAPGITGIISLVLGVALSAKSIEQALTTVVILLAVLAVMLTVITVILHSKKIKSPMRLDEELGNEGYLSSDDLEYLVGKEGVTTTDLRPTGKCIFDGVTFEVRSENSFIAANKEIEVIKIQSNAIIVREK